MSAKPARPMTRERALEIISNDPEIQRILAQPVGSPIPKLSKRQALAIVVAGIGADPTLPSGEEFMRRVRPMWRGLTVGDGRPD